LASFLSKRLDVDLRFDAVPKRARAADDAPLLDLHTLAHAARSPRQLLRLLRNERYGEVHVREGELPLSALQAACLVFTASVPAHRFVVDGRELSRPSFLLRALLKSAVAVPSEMLRSAVLARRVSRASRRHVELPRFASAARTALYVRVDPSLNWMSVQVGGAATHTTGVINGLIDNDVAVNVLAAEQPRATERARFVRVPARRMLHLIPGLAYTEYTEAIVRAGANFSADFVYQRSRLGSDAGLDLANRLGVPLVLEFNSSELWTERHWSGGRMPLRRAFGRLERRNLRDASLIVVVSNALRNSVVAEGTASERVLVNPNGVDIDELEPLRRKTAAQWRVHAGLPDEPSVGFVGTFGRWHGVKLLPALADAVPDCRWILIGDGPLFAEVRSDVTRRGLDDRVLMTGVVDRPRALELLACCDVCVSPHVPNPDGTPFFGSPTKLFEYMGLRRPIVASDLDQIGEILTHEETALLCTPGDVEELAAAVRRLLSDAGLRERLADAAFKLAVSQYTWKAHVRRIIEALTAGGEPFKQGSIGTVEG
jgi:glycosyltransferase involved in cell wall biosynthesis